MNLDNFVSAEKIGNKLIYHFSCTRCGNDYIKSSLAKNKGICPCCKLADAKTRAKITNENYRQRAAKEVAADVRRLVRSISDKQTVIINGIEYIKKNAVLDGINAYFNQQ
jgi:ribosomal protein L44E